MTELQIILLESVTDWNFDKISVFGMYLVPGMLYSVSGIRVCCLGMVLSMWSIYQTGIFYDFSVFRYDLLCYFWEKNFNS